MRRNHLASMRDSEGLLASILSICSPLPESSSHYARKPFAARWWLDAKWVKNKIKPADVQCILTVHGSDAEQINKYQLCVWRQSIGNTTLCRSETNNNVMRSDVTALLCEEFFDPVMILVSTFMHPQWPHNRTTEARKLSYDWTRLQWVTGCRTLLMGQQSRRFQLGISRSHRCRTKVPNFYWRSVHIPR